MTKSMRQIQSRLKELGLYTGEVDGLSGPLTRHAVRAFQRIHGLYVDAKVGPITLGHLFPDPIPERDDPTISALNTPRPTQNIWPRQVECNSFYGPVGKGQKMLELPYPMKLAWDLRKTIHRFYVHEKVHDSAARCLERIASAYSAAERTALGIDLFGGCLNVRKMRGGSSYSMHSWGIALDFDPLRNQLKWGRDRARLAQPDANKFWDIWEDEGWVSLGRARNFDWMHVQAARL